MYILPSYATHLGGTCLGGRPNYLIVVIADGDNHSAVTIAHNLLCYSDQLVTIYIYTPYRDVLTVSFQLKPV